MGTSDHCFCSIYRKVLPPLPTAFKQLLLECIEPWERQTANLKCHYSSIQWCVSNLFTISPSIPLSAFSPSLPPSIPPSSVSPSLSSSLLSSLDPSIPVFLSSCLPFTGTLSSNPVHWTTKWYYFKVDRTMQICVNTHLQQVHRLLSSLQHIPTLPWMVVLE